MLLEVDLKAIVTDEESLPTQSLRADPSACGMVHMQTGAPGRTWACYLRDADKALEPIIKESERVHDLTCALELVAANDRLQKDGWLPCVGGEGGG